MYGLLAGSVILFEIVHYLRHKRVFLFSYALLSCIGVSLIIQHFLVQLFLVPTNSMFPTIHEGDLTVSIPYKQGQQLFRGDVIVFKSPAFPSFIYIKRILAIGGDIVEYKADKTFWINGTQLGKRYYTNSRPEYALFEGVQERNGKPYVYVTDSRKPYVQPIYTSWVIPEGYVFVIGDNRDNSWDSRYWENPIGTPKNLRGLLPITKINSVYRSTLINIPFAKDSFDLGTLGISVITENQKQRDFSQ